MDFAFSWEVDVVSWLLLAAGVVAAISLIRQSRRRLAEQIARNQDAASRAGMGYTPPEADSPATEINEATHRFSGRDGHIAWTVEALALDDQEVGLSAAHSGNHQCYTRWSTSALTTGGGHLIAMHLQPGTPMNTKPGEGWLGKLTNNLGGLALGLFVRTAFGATRSQSIHLGPENWLQDADQAFAQRYRVFGTSANLLAKITPAARTALLGAHDQRVVMLWTEKELVLTWPTPRVKPEQVAAVAQWGVELVELMQPSDFGYMQKAPNGNLLD